LSGRRKVGPFRTLLRLLPLALLAACTPPADSTAAVLTVDDFGDTVRLAGPARRIVSLNPVTTELLFALGAGDRLVGRTHWDLYPDAARAVPDVGDGMQPNVEAVLGRQPDLVLLYASEPNRAATQQLHAAGIATLTLRTDRIADLARTVPIIAAAIGDSAAGAMIVDSVTATLNTLRAAPRPAQERSVYWHIWDAPLLTIGAGSYLSELLDVVGAANLFGDIAAPSPQVSLEEIARRDPYAVLAGPASAARIRTHPGWQAVRAVREGRVLVIDTTIVGRPGVRMGEAAHFLRGLIFADSAR
jgi:iron complex transport system substrate-binding protein